MKRLWPCLLGLPGAVAAAEHRVQIGPGPVYSPSELTIRAGDSVRFTASQAHPLAADDGSFACLEDCVLRFDRLGTHGFHCDTHGAPNAGMAGAVHVVSGGATLPPAPAFDGTWYDPAASGQGVTIETVPATGQVILGWFTWSDAGDGRHDWLTGLGPIVGPRADLVLTRSAGGRFDAPAPIVSTPVGRATLRFFDCSTASLQFTREDNHRSGILALRRLAPARADCAVP